MACAGMSRCWRRRQNLGAGACCRRYARRRRERLHRAASEEPICEESACGLSPSLHCAHSCIDDGYTITLGRHLHLPSPAHGSGNHNKKAPSPLQISDTLASIAFRGPEYTSNPGTEGIAQLIFDVPRAARVVSAHPRHDGDVDEDEGEAKNRIPPLFEVRGVVTVSISMPLGR